MHASKLTFLLALPLLFSTPTTAEIKEKIPWRPHWPNCMDTMIRPNCSKYGLRMCTNGCHFWVCGLCFGWEFPEVPVPTFPWPPADIVHVDFGDTVVYPYEKLTEEDFRKWLDVRGVEVGKEVVGKNSVFEVVAQELSKVACEAGVQGGEIVEE